MIKAALRCGVLAAAFIGTSVQAAYVIVGPPPAGTGNCDPFGCPVFFGLGTYQQVYASTAFSAPLTFSTITFSDTVTHNNGSKAQGTYTLSFSYTSKAVGMLDLTNYQNNIGPGSQTFFSGPLPNIIPIPNSSSRELVISGTPFNYNPASGNLLLTVTMSSPVDPTTALYLDFASSTSQTTNAYFGSAGNGGNTTGGLVTEFASALQITGPASLPSGTAGMAYGPVTFTASGGVPSYTWSATGLPAGLTLSTVGVLSGTPTTSSPGSYNPVFTVTDTNSTTTSVTLSLLVIGSLQITGPSSLAPGTVGVAYGPVTFMATGGTGGYTWSATGLPSGLTFSTSGVLSGTPAAGSQGSYTPQFKVIDSSSNTTSATLPLLINTPALQISSPTGLGSGSVGVPYGPVTFVATGGTGSYTWSATGLPIGLSFTTGGVLTGTPATGGQGNYNPQFTVTDSSSKTNSETLPLLINPGFTTLANFIATNGATPEGALVLGADGNLYGTTYYGGTASTGGNGQDAFGTIFSMAPSGGPTTLYSFTNGTDGSGPAAGLIQSSADGNFYGTTSGQNGQHGFGTVFKYATATSTLTTLYAFTGAGDGSVPLAGLVQGTDGNFYGTTSAGGTNGAGTIFQFQPSSGSLNTLYSFQCLAANTGCTDGRVPLAGLIQGTDGNLYGTTSAGGTGGAGTIFNITTTGTLTTLYSFCVASGCIDGSTPVAGLMQAADGNFYGTTQVGGTTNNGAVFKYTPGQGLTTLYSFTGSGPDGGSPAATLVLGTDGNFYGTTQQGGAGNSGTVFQVTPAGSLSSLPLSGTDGSNPAAALVQCPTSTTSCPSSGVSLYGTAKNGGSNSDGTVFSVMFTGPVTYTISGQVTLAGSGLSGVTVTLSGSQSGTVVTNSSGGYSFNVAGGGSYTVTPSLADYTFSPPSQTFNSLSGNQTQNFVASRVMFTISGQVTLSGSGLSGVTVTLSGSQSGSVVTTSSGNYSFTVDAGGSYTVTPSLAGYSFTPASQTFNGLSGNQTQNVVASTLMFTISGQVTLSGSGLSGVTVTLSGSQSGSVVTTSSGSYSFTVGAGGNYTVTPSLTGYTFAPPSQTFNSLSSNQTQNFVATQVMYTISGQVTLSGSGLSGVTVTLSGSQSGTVVTTSSGGYSFSVAVGGNYTVTPSLTGYTFNPTSKSFNNLSGNQTQNFTATQVTYTISGQVILSGSGLSGVTVTLSGSQSGSVVTNSSGSYSFSVGAGGTYTVTPALSGYTFTPSSQTFTNLSGNQVQNFVATPVQFTISGQVTLSGSGLSGVTVTLSGSQSGTVITNSSGSYSFGVSAGGNYTVTPSLIGYTFAPPSQSFNNVNSNQTQNFIATQVMYTISGQVTLFGSGLSGVTVTLSGSQSGSVVTTSSGNYSFSAGAGGNYTVTPSLTGYSFIPSSQTFNNLSSNQTQNFIASHTKYTISGQVTLSGSGLAGVTVTLSGSQSGSVVTTSSGSYSFSAAAGGSYTVTPSLTGYMFAPASQTFNNLSANQTQNFVASVVMYTISGQVTLSGSGLGGVTVTLSGSQSGSVVTNSSGSYSFSVAAGGNYTVTPTLAAYTFTPPSQTFNNLSGNQSQNFAANTVTFTISGQVTHSGSGLAGVTVTLSGSQSGSVVTNSSGSYSFTVAQGGNYTVTPSLTGYTFAPPSQTFNNLSANQTQNFVATQAMYTISGQITLSGSGLSGVTVTLSGSQSGSVVTTGSGSYSFTVGGGGNYTVTPSLLGYTFTPPSQTYDDLSGNQTENFIATAATFTISGQVVFLGSPLAGVTVNLSGSQSGSFTTNSSGNYTFSVAAGGNYTVAPAPTGYTFTPSSQTYTNLGGNQSENFVASHVLYTISGQVTLSGSGLAGVTVTLSGSQGATTTTDSSGSYSFGIAASGDYQVVPALFGYTFSPANQTFTNVNSNETANFSAFSTAPVPTLFVPLAPCRVVDTRNPIGPLGGPALNNNSRDFAMPGICGIPSTAVAYSLNVTVIPSGTLNYLTIWPTGQPQPPVSTLNSLNGIIKADAAIVPAGANGSVSVYAAGPTDVVVDINGYFVANDSSKLAFYPVTPCRLVDTRNPIGPLGGPIMGPHEIRTFPLPSSSCNSIPAGAMAYSLNFTVVPSGPLYYLTTWPTGESQPVVSTLNASSGLVTANAAIVPAGTSGDINVFASDTTHVVIDINGYFAPPGSGGLSFYAAAPCRVVDTRNTVGALGGPELLGQRDFPLTSGSCGLPVNAQAFSLNATVVPADKLGYLTLWPAGDAKPVVSTLNSPDGSIDSNAAIVPTLNGSISAFSSDSTQLILDANGYFAP